MLRGQGSVQLSVGVFLHFSSTLSYMGIHSLIHSFNGFNWVAYMNLALC